MEDLWLLLRLSGAGRVAADALVLLAAAPLLDRSGGEERRGGGGDEWMVDVLMAVDGS